MNPNMTHTFNRYCLKHGHDWQPISTEGASMAIVKCSICGAIQYRL